MSRRLASRQSGNGGYGSGALKAYREVRMMILKRELAPGAPVVAVEIANRLGMSRMPVREALTRLHSEKLVRIMPRRGVFVRILSPDEVRHDYEAAEEFHETIVSRCDNDPLAGTRRQIWGRMETALAQPEPDLETWVRHRDVKAEHGAVVRRQGEIQCRPPRDLRSPWQARRRDGPQHDSSALEEGAGRVHQDEPQHVARASWAACVAPIPQTAKLFADPGSAPVPMFSQQPLDQSDILGSQFPALYYHDARHGSHGTT